MSSSFQDIAKKELETFSYVRFQRNKVSFKDGTGFFGSGSKEMTFIDSEISPLYS